MKNYFCVLLALILFSSYAQEVPKKWKFNFQLDNRFSSIRENETVIFGAKFGLQYKKRTRFGIGTSFILHPITITFTNKKTNLLSENKLSFWYVSVFDDLILYKKGNWECFVTEQIGYGKPNIIKEINNELVSDLNVDIYVNEISGQLNYKITRWAGAGVGAGYRSLIDATSILKTRFDAPIYIFKLIVYPETFFKN